MRDIGRVETQKETIVDRFSSISVPVKGYQARRSSPFLRLKNVFTRFLDSALFPSSEWTLRRRLIREGGRFPPRPPQHAWINTALKSNQQIQAALEEVRSCGLPPHLDLPKNWDAITALSLVLKYTGTSAKILDAGAPLYSRILPWLYMYGYRDLWGIDLVYSRPLRRGPIHYERGDLTGTRFDEGSFEAITCLSVIEHGVVLDAFLREMSRLLRPGGLLIISTDYWTASIDTRGQVAYGHPIKIFSEQDVAKFVTCAEGCGLRVLQPVDLECQERTITWKPYNLNYTSMSIALHKADVVSDNS